MWKAGLAMWREHPWTGVGLGDLKPIYREFASADVPRTYGHLHNDWVHLLATTGILGTAAFAWLMVGFGRIVWRSDARAGDPELRALALGAWGSFWGFQTMGLFEWNFGDVEVMLALYFLVGALQASARLQPDSRSPG
jgi:O-antigen ligase